MLDLKPLVIYSLVLVLPASYITYRQCWKPSPTIHQRTPETSKKPVKSIMQAPRDDLAPPKDDPYTVEDLRKYDGSNPELPIYVAIKGTIFDVTHKKDVYGPGKSYNIFAGKDGSRGFGKSSLKTEDAVADYSTLDEKDRKVLDDWHSFFCKRYNIVGKVIDTPPSGSENASSSL